MGRRSTFRVVFTDLPDNIRRGLGKLLEAYRYAHDVERDLWDFAVEIRALRAAGLSKSDLRWLVCKGYVEHRVELDRPEEDKRQFGKASELKFYKRSCFVLTPDGAALATTTGDPTMDEQPLASPSAANSQNGENCPQGLVPQWDPVRHELRVSGKVVKHYKVRSPNQETILTAFQEEGWPASVDDPLPPQPEQDPKRRLHDTIKCLNKNQKNRLIHFRGDGTGEGVLWELVNNGQPTDDNP